jgi:hypothetical protein
VRTTQVEYTAKTAWEKEGELTEIKTKIRQLLPPGLRTFWLRRELRRHDPAMANLLSIETNGPAPTVPALRSVHLDEPLGMERSVILPVWRT